MSSNPSDITSCTYSTGSAERDGDDEEDEFEEEFPLSSFSKSEKSEESDDGGNEGSSKMKNENDMKIDSNGNKIGLKYNGNTTSYHSHFSFCLNLHYHHHHFLHFFLILKRMIMESPLQIRPLRRLRPFQQIPYCICT